MQRLLGKQQIDGDVQTRDLGTGSGDAVDVYLPHTSRIIRFQLSHCDYPAWRRHTDALRSKAVGGVDWVFGPDGPATRELLNRDAYFLRVRLETVGGERRIHIGTEARDRSVTWTPLGDCTFTSTGLSTPSVESIRISHPRSKLPSFPLAGGLVFRPLEGAEVLSDTRFAAPDRRLINADVRPVDSPIVRALLSSPATATRHRPTTCMAYLTPLGYWSLRTVRAGSSRRTATSVSTLAKPSGLDSGRHPRRRRQSP